MIHQPMKNCWFRQISVDQKIFLVGSMCLMKQESSMINSADWLNHVYYRHPWSNVNRYPPWTLYQHLSWHSIDTPLTSRSTVSQELTNFQLIHKSQSTLSRLSTYCWSSVDRVSIGMSIEHWSRCWSWVPIESMNRHTTADAFSAHDPTDLDWEIAAEYQGLSCCVLKMADNSRISECTFRE